MCARVYVHMQHVCVWLHVSYVYVSLGGVRVHMCIVCAGGHFVCTYVCSNTEYTCMYMVSMHMCICVVLCLYRWTCMHSHMYIGLGMGAG